MGYLVGVRDLVVLPIHDGFIVKAQCEVLPGGRRLPSSPRGRGDDMEEILLNP